MTDNIRSLHESAAQKPTLQELHTEFCARDIMRLADLMLLGKEQGTNLHSAFARHAFFARRYNHEFFPDPAMDVEAMYSADINRVARNFRQQFEDIHRANRIPADAPDLQGQMAYRVLSDSSPYLDNLVKWMERNRDTNGFDKFRSLNAAVKLLTNSHLVQLRSEDQLKALIEQGIARVREQPVEPVMVTSPFGKPGVV